MVGCSADQAAVPEPCPITLPSTHSQRGLGAAKESPIPNGLWGQAYNGHPIMLGHVWTRTSNLCYTASVILGQLWH